MRDEGAVIASVSRLSRYRIEGEDGSLGRAEDFYFDDHAWRVRHLVVRTGRWLGGRRFLLPPAAVRQVDAANRVLRVALTRAQAEGSPGVDADRPVSRQHEIELYRYFGFPYQWSPPFVLEDPRRWEGQGDPHLRSTRDVTGYHTRATDGPVGRVADFLLEAGPWAIRYLVVDTHVWRPGKHVLVAPAWVERVSWGEVTVHLDLDRARVETAPPYHHGRPLDREYEARLFAHYGRPGYWVESATKAGRS